MKTPSSDHNQTVDLGGTAGATDGAHPDTGAAHAERCAAKFLEGKPPVVSIKRPSWGVYEHPVSLDSGREIGPGVYWHTTRTDAEGERHPSDEKISTPVIVAARTLSADDDSEGRYLRFPTYGGWREWVLPMEVFGGSGEDAKRRLFAMGVRIELKKRGAFMEYLLDQTPAQTFTTTTRPGWYESEAFVLPGRTIGSETVRFQSSGIAKSLFSSRGDLGQWQSLVASKCLGNPVLTLAVACALAGPLLSLVGVNGGGVHLVGDSSKGKTLAQLIAATVWGDPARFASSWDMTKGGLEIEASSRNDTVLILDEIKRANPKYVQEMAYSLANGQGKATMNRDRESRAKNYWRLLTISSGERSLSEHAAISGNAAHAGAELRMVDINAGTRAHGAFDDTHGMAAADFHRGLTMAANQHYGHLGPAFVERLITSGALDGVQDEFRKVRERFASGDAQSGRIADRFSVIALAGEKAIEYGLLPWPVGTCLQHCQSLYGEWLCKVGIGSAEDRQILAAVADFIDRHGGSRFSDVKASDADVTVRDRAGYWEAMSGGTDGRLYLFNRSGLAEAAHGYSFERIIRALESVDALAKRDSDGNRNSKKYRLPGGGSARLYVIDYERLGGEGRSA